MRVLAFDTSGPVLTVGIAADGRAVLRRDCPATRGRGNLLEREIEAALSQCDWQRGDVEGLALVTGPGSLTAIRIAWATAAGWAQAQQIPVTGWTVAQAQARRAAPDTHHCWCAVHYRGNVFLLYHLDDPTHTPRPVDLSDGSVAAHPPRVLTGPGVIGYRERWQAYIGPQTVIAADADAFVGGDILALWGEADLRTGHRLSLAQSPLEYGLPPDFRKLHQP
ncbi:MAG TPA: tRNA (adenosine(37)-N6)-threonylcarbamoyltransferase complex dimerization subunit type 1 TsaB [bacterium]|nr:tRNA (adenosine(37)-N6)-threonylcarbamoyltransferase complex dimerization subunit type 1 TsaB [bacterium]